MPKIKYTPKQRQEIIDFFNSHTLKEFKEKYNIGYTTVRCWIDPQFHQKQKNALKKSQQIKLDINHKDKTLCVINCAAQKKDYPCIASQMYEDSILFRKMKDYAQKNYDEYIILSAYYGVLWPNDVIQPYKDTVMFVSNELLHSGKEYKHLNVEEKKEWAKKVFKSIIWSRYKQVDFLTGYYYWEYLKPYFKKYDNVKKISLKEGIGHTINHIETLNKDFRCNS